MKQLLIISLLVLGLGAAAQDDFARANDAYIAGSYGEAIARYDSILDRGQASAKLYYNLAGAHFKLEHLGRAILYYKKAQRLAPTDRDIAHNLAVAEAMTHDRIEPLPEFFAARWLRTLRQGLPGNGWAGLGLLFFGLGAGALLLYLLGRGTTLRKAGFWGACACALLFALSLHFALANHRQMQHPREGIVMRMRVAVKSAPDAQSKELYIVNEGTQVRITGELGAWREVELSDGKKGWVEISSIEII